MTRVLRGRIVVWRDDPLDAGAAARRYVEDGAILIRDGRVAALGEAAAILRDLPPDIELVDCRPHLLMPGFIDPHLHAPQTHVIASYGAELIEWLQKYTFVEEQRHADAAHAARCADFLCDELLRNGTTTACVYTAVYPCSAEAVFAAAQARDMRMIVGKTMMDRNAPAALTDTPQRGYDESKALIARWHKRGRQLFAVTPRFAITSSEAQLECAGALLREHPDCLMQTHLDENPREIDWVRELFPWSEDYAQVYERFGLLGSGSLLGHCIHMTDGERKRLSDSRSVAVFCPTSNLFIGSGLFDLDRARDPRFPLRLAIATDIGGGTSYSMLTTLGEAYKALMLRGQRLTADRAFYMATLGNARALGLEAQIGSLAIGAEADVVVLDSRATPAMAHRAETLRDLDEELFLLMTMGDDRAVAATYVMGERVHARA
ncbi:MAG: guanine deaminase [Methylobacteriaceae bacterium]|nr:guanine deaminase [Methylobacteriaceae bacterium]